MKKLAGKPIAIPRERKTAQARYEEHFGQPWPIEMSYNVYGNNWQKEVEHIDRCIAENKPVQTERQSTKKVAY